MKPIRFPSERLEALFRETKVVTLPQLKAALGTTVDLTVFRKLSALPYRTSYSHRGAYYTLDPVAQYDELGLWSYNDKRSPMSSLEIRPPRKTGGSLPSGGDRLSQSHSVLEAE